MSAVGFDGTFFFWPVHRRRECLTFIQHSSFFVMLNNYYSLFIPSFPSYPTLTLNHRSFVCVCCILQHFCKYQLPCSYILPTSVFFVEPPHRQRVDDRRPNSPDQSCRCLTVQQRRSGRRQLQHTTRPLRTVRTFACVLFRMSITYLSKTIILHPLSIYL